MKLALFLVAMVWIVTWIIGMVCLRDKNPNDRQDRFMDEGKGD